jgi:hypothetical protein
MGSDLLRNRGIFVVDMDVKLLIDVTKPGPQFLFFSEEMGEKVMDGVPLMVKGKVSLVFRHMFRLLLNIQHSRVLERGTCVRSIRSI